MARGIDNAKEPPEASGKHPGRKARQASAFGSAVKLREWRQVGGLLKVSLRTNWQQIGERTLLAYSSFIAITAVARLIVLQGKDMDAQNPVYEAGAIMLLALPRW